MNSGLECLDRSVFGGEYNAEHWKEILPESASMGGFEENSYPLPTESDIGLVPTLRMPMAEISVNSSDVKEGGKVEKGQSIAKKARKTSYPNLAKTYSNARKPQRMYVSMNRDQITDVQKEILVDAVLKCKSFVKPSREFSQKWGVLITERTIQRLYDDYISNFPHQEVTKEMLDLRGSDCMKSFDTLTLAERFEIFDLCENVASPDAAQIIYECYGKIINCNTVTKILKNKRSRLELSIEDRIGIVNMASSEGLIPAARFYAQKCNAELSEAMVQALTEIAGTLFKRYPCPASAVDPNMQLAISSYARSHTLTQTANKFSPILGYPLAESAVHMIKSTVKSQKRE